MSLEPVLRIRIRYAFGPPGSGTMGTRFGSRSGSFYQAKIVLKNLDSYYFFTSLSLFIFKNYVNVASKSSKESKIIFSSHLEGH
jgi:hypothetical protein